MVPAWRGGRLVDWTTVLVDPAKPTSSGEMPRSARDSVCTGFFFAAMMPFSDGYRGSLIVSHTETIAGVAAVTTSYPSSVCRSTVSVPPSTVSLRAPVSAAMPSRSAIMCGITCTRPSVDSAPASTRSGLSVRSAAASTFEVATAQEPCRAPSRTWTALSGPICSALRIASPACSGPIVRTVTSPPSASWSLSASSTAYSSISLSTLFAELRSMVWSSDRSSRSAPESGTCLTSTTMFIALRQPPDRRAVTGAFPLPPGGSTRRACQVDHA